MIVSVNLLFVYSLVSFKLLNLWKLICYSHSEHTKKLLAECASSHLKHKKFTTDYGSRLTSSSARILLQSVPGRLFTPCLPNGGFVCQRLSLFTFAY